MKHCMYSLDEEVLQELQNRTGHVNLSGNQMIRRVLDYLRHIDNTMLSFNQ